MRLFQGLFSTFSLRDITENKQRVAFNGNELQLNLRDGFKDIL